MFATALAFGLRNWKPLAIGFALLAVFAWHQWQVSSAFKAGREAEKAAALVEANKRIKQRELNDAKFRSLSEVERCRILLRDSGLPIDGCGQ